MKKVTDLSDDEVIHCRTIEDADAICKIMHDAGLTWISCQNYIGNNKWDINKENTCYYPSCGTYGDITIGRDIIIHPASDFIVDSKYGSEYLKTLEEAKNKRIREVLQNRERLKNMEPRVITYSQAQEIIDCACGNWTEILANRWATNIVRRNNIIVDEEFYQEMRRACIGPQHIIFDNIFGRDEPKYKVGDKVIVDGYHNSYDNKVLTINKINDGGFCYFDEGVPNCSNFDIKRVVRLATEEEIRKASCYPDQTPCLVRASSVHGWEFRYADGNGRFYNSSRKSGPTTRWDCHMKLDVNNLPTE